MKKLKFICGAILLVLSIHGIVHAASATLAQGLYAQAKYGSLNDDATAVLRRCKSAHSLYPHNYNLCILAARTAFVDHFGSDTEKTQEEASLWCKEGLRLNPYRIEFRLLKTRLLQKITTRSY